MEELAIRIGDNAPSIFICMENEMIKTCIIISCNVNCSTNSVITSVDTTNTLIMVWVTVEAIYINRLPIVFTEAVKNADNITHIIQLVRVIDDVKNLTLVVLLEYFRKREISG